MKIVLYIGGAIVALWFIGGLIRHNKGKNKVIRVVKDNCTGCGSCIRRCNHKVFEMLNEEQGKHIVVKYPDKCTGCGDCLSKCKFNALELVEKK